jgi:hypothetical protein
VRSLAGAEGVGVDGEDHVHLLTENRARACTARTKSFFARVRFQKQPDSAAAEEPCVPNHQARSSKGWPSRRLMSGNLGRPYGPKVNNGVMCDLEQGLNSYYLGTKTPHELDFGFQASIAHTANPK